jgi:UDP-glucuronate 4-epimerase
MALFKFTEAILQGRPIDIYNQGQMEWDFTCVDDVVESISRLCPKPPVPDKMDEGINRTFNLGRGKPVKLLDFVDCLETALGMKAQRHLLPMQAGDVINTWADVTALADRIGFSPQVEVEASVAWRSLCGGTASIIGCEFYG